MGGWSDKVGPKMVTAFGVVSEVVTYKSRDGYARCVRVILDPSVEVRDNFGTVLERRTEIEILNGDVSQPQRGDLVDTGRRQYMLLELLNEDQVSQRWSAAAHGS